MTPIQQQGRKMRKFWRMDNTEENSASLKSWARACAAHDGGERKDLAKAWLERKAKKTAKKKKTLRLR